MESKGWNWSEVSSKLWTTPAPTAITYSTKWKEEGYTSVLDLGCGLGRNTFVFVKDGFITTATDISPDAIKYVEQIKNEQNIPLTCRVADMLNLPFSDNSFDCVFAYHVISHQDTQGVKNAFKEINRILKPNGKCFVTLGSKKHPAFCSSDKVFVDENTILKNKVGEENVPHFYIDNEDLKFLQSDFTFESINEISIYNNETLSLAISHFELELKTKK